MPWKIEKQNDKFCVVKEADGEVEGCHESNEQAMAQLAALNASEKEGDTETKMYDDDEAQEMGGPTSWEELDAQHMAMEQAANMQQVTHQFQMLVQNVLGSDMPNKGAAIGALSAGLSERLNETKEKEATAADIITKEQHYKEVAHDDTLAVESDFEGGCTTCHFGDPTVMKELANCPYCWSELEVCYA
jgi:hypothetical protein